MGESALMFLSLETSADDQFSKAINHITAQLWADSSRLNKDVLKICIFIALVSVHIYTLVLIPHFYRAHIFKCCLQWLTYISMCYPAVSLVTVESSYWKLPGIRYIGHYFHGSMVLVWDGYTAKSN